MRDHFCRHIPILEDGLSEQVKLYYYKVQLIYCVALLLIFRSIIMVYLEWGIRI